MGGNELFSGAKRTFLWGKSAGLSFFRQRRGAPGLLQAGRVSVSFILLEIGLKINSFLGKQRSSRTRSLWERPERTASSRQAARSPGTELGQSPRSSWVPRPGAGQTARGGSDCSGHGWAPEPRRRFGGCRETVSGHALENSGCPHGSRSLSNGTRGCASHPSAPHNTAVVTAPRRYALTTSLATRLCLWLPGAHSRVGGPRPCAAVGRVPLPALAGAGEGFTAGAQPPSPYPRTQYSLHRAAPSQPLNFLPAPVTNHRQNRACCWPFTASSPHGTKGRIRSSRARMVHLPERGRLPAASRGREPRHPPARAAVPQRYCGCVFNPSAEVSECSSYYSCPAAAAATPSFRNNIFSNEVAENSFTFLLSLPAQNKKCLCCHYLIQSSGVHWIPTGYECCKKLTGILINKAMQRLSSQASGNRLCFVHYLL